uniref:Uncharacterized protein n=1 Tax=Globisporangium ultimum (strain ATCC 200006 / CBS 805.95 / DAOM BR144) TaxID=431595 RepID=K3WY45_GLOUD
MFKEKRADLCLYLLFLTHEYPFFALEEAMGTTWECVQGVYHRLIIPSCTGITVRERIRQSKNSSVAANKIPTDCKRGLGPVHNFGRFQASESQGSVLNTQELFRRRVSLPLFRPFAFARN